MQARQDKIVIISSPIFCILLSMEAWLPWTGCTASSQESCRNLVARLCQLPLKLNWSRKIWILPKGMILWIMLRIPGERRAWIFNRQVMTCLESLSTSLFENNWLRGQIVSEDEVMSILSTLQAVVGVKWRIVWSEQGVELRGASHFGFSVIGINSIFCENSTGL